MSSANSPAANSVLVTGATSFLGQTLVRRLEARGTDVHALIRPTSDVTPLAELCALHVHDGNISSMQRIVDAARPDAVLHLATCYRRGHTGEDIADLIETNVHLGTQLLQAMAGAGCCRLVTVGSFFQYYDSHGYRPVNLYAATKQAFEDILTYYEDAHGLRAAKLVLYEVYGEGDPRRKLMTAIRDAQRAGQPLPLPERPITLDLVHVDDVVAALIHVLDEGIVGGPYAVSTGARHSVEDVVALFETIGARPIERRWGAFALPARNPEVPWVGPPLPNWQPTVTLEDGIRRLLAEDVGDAD